MPTRSRRDLPCGPNGFPHKRCTKSVTPRDSLRGFLYCLTAIAVFCAPRAIAQDPAQSQDQKNGDAISESQTLSTLSIGRLLFLGLADTRFSVSPTFTLTAKSGCFFYTATAISDASLSDLEDSDASAQSCAALRSRLKVRVLLGGSLSDLQISAAATPSVAGDWTRLRTAQIAINGLQMTLDRGIEFGKLPDYFGGTVAIPEEPESVSNQEEIDIRPTITRGSLEFQTSALTLTRAQLSLPITGTLATITLQAPEAKLTFSLADARLVVSDAGFAGPFSIPRPLTAQPLVGQFKRSFVIRHLAAKNLTLKVLSNHANLAVDKLEFDIDGAFSPSNASIVAVFQGHLTMTMEGEVSLSKTVAAIQDPTVKSATFNSVVPAQAQSSCTEALLTLSPVQSTFFDSLDIKSPASQQADRLKKAINNLADLSAVDFLLNVPASDVSLLLSRWQADNFSDTESRVRLNKQRVIQCLNQKNSAEFHFPLLIAMTREAIVDNGSILLRRRDAIVHVKDFATNGSERLSVLINQAKTETAQKASTLDRASDATFRIPFQLDFETSFSDLKTDNRNGSYVPTKRTFRISHLALLIDDDGIHVAGNGESK